MVADSDRIACADDVEHQKSGPGADATLDKVVPASNS